MAERRAACFPFAYALGAEERPFNVADAVDGLRYLLMQASALCRILEGSIERDTWGDDVGEDRRRLKALSHLVGAAVEALLVATNAGDRIAAQLANLAGGRIAAQLAKHRTGA